MTKHELDKARDNLMLITVVFAVAYWFFPNTVLLTLMLVSLFMAICSAISDPTEHEHEQEHDYGSFGNPYEAKPIVRTPTATSSYNVLDNHKNWFSNGEVNEKAVAIDLFALAAAMSKDFNVQLQLNESAIEKYINEQNYEKMIRSLLDAIYKAGHPRIIVHMFKGPQGEDTVRYVLRKYGVDLPG